MALYVDCRQQRSDVYCQDRRKYFPVGCHKNILFLRLLTIHI